jgi:hypothetical protein
MKNRIYVGVTIGLLVSTVAFITQQLLLLGIVWGMTLYFVIRLFDKAKVQYSRKHYRIYNPILFWNKGLWKPMANVMKIFITKSESNGFYRMVSGIKYQVCLMNGYGYDKIFESRSLEAAQQKAQEIIDKFNLTVETALVQDEKSSKLTGEKKVNKKWLTLSE